MKLVRFAGNYTHKISILLSISKHSGTFISCPGPAMFSRSLLSIKRAIFKDVVERRQIFSICRNNHLPLVGII